MVEKCSEVKVKSRIKVLNLLVDIFATCLPKKYTRTGDPLSFAYQEKIANNKK